jgi:hypothetical protein
MTTGLFWEVYRLIKRYEKSSTEIINYSGFTQELIKLVINYILNRENNN